MCSRRRGIVWCCASLWQSTRQQLLPFLILIIIIFSGCCVFFYFGECVVAVVVLFFHYFGSFKSAYMRSHVENTIFGKNGICYERKQFMSKNNVCRFAIFSISSRCIPVFSLLYLSVALFLCYCLLLSPFDDFFIRASRI